MFGLFNNCNVQAFILLGFFSMWFKVTNYNLNMRTKWFKILEISEHVPIFNYFARGMFLISSCPTHLNSNFVMLTIFHGCQLK